MNIEMTQSEQPVSLEKIAEIERDYSFSFPQQYKDFLLQSNGGKAYPRNFVFDVGEYGGSRIDRFLAIYDGKNDNFETYFKVYKLDMERIPNNLIPMAHDDGGNLICISVCGSDRGSVYFWDHEYELEEEENIFLIKRSFNEFMASLT